MPENIGTAWDEIFTVDNILEYANAGFHLSEYLRTLFLEGYDSIVIPSRGALPIFKIAYIEWLNRVRNLPTLDDSVQEMVQVTISPIIRPLILPFSSDPTGNQNSSEIRRYWTKVLSAVVRRAGRDPYLLFYRFVVENLAKKPWSSVTPRRLPSAKFIFIDTVISGRAIVEIMDAFEEEGLDQCYFILLLDQNGHGLKDKYRAKIERLEATNRCTTVTVKSLWTEDRGPAVSGVWSTVYPEVAQRLRETHPWAKAAYGAGSFYHKVSSSPETPTNTRANPEYNMPVTHMHGILGTLYSTALSAIHDLNFPRSGDLGHLDRTSIAFSPGEYWNRTITDERSKTKAVLPNIIAYLKDSITQPTQLSPLDKETTLSLAEPRVLRDLRMAKVKVSSSHIVRVHLTDKDISSLFSTFQNDYLRRRINALSDEWFV